MSDEKNESDVQMGLYLLSYEEFLRETFVTLSYDSVFAFFRRNIFPSDANIFVSKALRHMMMSPCLVNTGILAEGPIH